MNVYILEMKHEGFLSVWSTLDKAIEEAKKHSDYGEILIIKRTIDDDNKDFLIIASIEGDYIDWEVQE